MEHSKTPWGYWPECCREGGMITSNEYGGHVAAPTFFKNVPELTTANALFIVKACNCHADLLEACKEAFNQIQYMHEKFKITGSGSQILARLNLAIAKCEGK